MPANSPYVEKPFSIPADLDVAEAAEAHALLVSALDEVEASGRGTRLDLTEGTATPLALQLVASAARAFPSDRLRLGPRAAVALAAFEASKEN
ncbi:hypothetical protein [uncultured Jannaschia sp.]|uniref:hypothetical protein n=1 Tax=uncultured Jannaschia sp. TaxID=293347 RepID=UPI002628B185|nr:hypothetical protein [uncultured Jannaschia sp.]